MDNRLENRVSGLTMAAALTAAVSCAVPALAQPFRTDCAVVICSWNFERSGRTCLGAYGYVYAWQAIPFHEEPYWPGLIPPVTHACFDTAEGTLCGKYAECLIGWGGPSITCRHPRGNVTSYLTAALNGGYEMIEMQYHRPRESPIFYESWGASAAGVSADISWSDSVSSTNTIDVTTGAFLPVQGRLCPFITVIVYCEATETTMVYYVRRCDFVHGDITPPGWTAGFADWTTELEFEACAGDVTIRNIGVVFSDIGYDLNEDGRFNEEDVADLSALVSAPASGDLVRFDFDGDGYIQAFDVSFAQSFVDAGLSAGLFGDFDNNGRITCSDETAASSAWSAIAGDTNYVIRLDLDLDGELSASDETAFDALTFYSDADINQDGIVDFVDYLEFLDLFAEFDRKADMNGDGIVDFLDYLAFLDAFASPTYC